MSSKNIKNIIENNYGSIYKTTGGGKKQFGGKNIKSWIKKILGNRPLDVYLKYLGIKTLTTASMVPMSLILGGDYLASFLKNEQSGGFIPGDLPIIDNELVGNYLKLVGLSVMDITPATILPLGVLMIIYDLSVKHMSTKQSGGGRVITGSSIPVSTVQNLDYFFRGLTSPEPLVDIFDRTNHAQQACSTGNCNANVYSSHNPFWTDKVSVKGFPALGIPTKIAQNSWSGELITPTRKYIPKSMAGGERKKNKQTKKQNKREEKKRAERELQEFNGNVDDGFRNNKGEIDDVSKILQMSFNEQEGSGSDWMSSQYSRGPVNTATMSDAQFRAFNKTSENMSNTKFATQYSSKNLPHAHVPLFTKKINSVSSISTSQYGSGNGLAPNELRGERSVNYDVSTSQFGGKSSLWNKIKNPKTGKLVNVTSPLGKKIIQNYLNQI